jgi:hypothetical protein
MLKMISHLIYTGAGVYEPRICPKTVLWQRVPPGEADPMFGVFVPNVENARLFAQVTVVFAGNVVAQFDQHEQHPSQLEAA